MNVRMVSISIGSTLLALTLIGLGLVELIDPAVLGPFATWGYPERFHGLRAAVEIGGGVLLLLPGVAWYSAALLGVLLVGAIGTHLWNGQPYQLVPSTLLLTGVALVGYARHPRTLVLARLRAVAEAVALREIEQERQRLAKKGTEGQSPLSKFKATNARTRPDGRAAAATNSAARKS